MNRIKTIIYHSDNFAVLSQPCPDLLAILDDWLTCQRRLSLQQQRFDQLIKSYGLHAPQLLANARLRQFQRLLSENLALPARLSDWQQQRLTYLHCQGLFYAWSRCIADRLSYRGYTLQGRWQHQSTLQPSKAGGHIDIAVRSDFMGTAQYRLEEDDDNHAKILDILPARGLVLIHTDYQTRLSLATPQQPAFSDTHAHASLFAPEMRRPFITATPEEKINQVLLSNQSLDPNDTALLEDARAFYRQTIDEYAFSQTLISRKNYSEAFKASPIYACLQAVLAERPIEGLTLPA